MNPPRMSVAAIAQRRIDALRVEYDLPPGCVDAYHPGCNILIPVAHHPIERRVRATKSVHVRLEKAT